MDTMLQNRMERLLALTGSTNEHEAALAMEKLQALLIKHNLDIADLETRGHKTAPGVKEKSHDLGKAAFRWKLDLAEYIAEHYFCYPLVDRTTKTVRFVGRPDNVESLTALYAWVIEQIKTISRNERRKYIEETGEHIDPLRWQVNFGLGAVSRLSDRLYEIKRRQAEDNKVHALVLHHKSEISDWLEEELGYRIDGQMTKSQRESRERLEAKRQFKAECEANGDMEPYYQRYPWDRPLSEEEQRKADERHAEWEEEWKARQARSERSRRAARTRRARNGMSDEEYRRYMQAYRAEDSGRKAADQVNLEPFLNPGERQEVEEREALGV